jgi:hypothetical protein
MHFVATMLMWRTRNAHCLGGTSTSKVDGSGVISLINSCDSNKPNQNIVNFFDCWNSHNIEEVWITN